MACGTTHICPDCRDRLIHQENRGHHESSSAFGQFVHDKFGNDFWAGDIDQYQMRRTDKTFRILEVKKPGGKLSSGQRALLPILADGLAVSGPAHGYSETGVFVVEWAVGRRAARVTQFLPGGGAHRFEVYDEDFDQFVTARSMRTIAGIQAAA